MARRGRSGSPARVQASFLLLSCPSAPPRSDLAQHGVVLVVTGAAPSMRPLLLAHGVPLPPAPLDWPPEMEAPQAAGREAGGCFVPFTGLWIGGSVGWHASQQVGACAEDGGPFVKGLHPGPHWAFPCPPPPAPVCADVQPSVRGSRCGSPRGRTPGGRSTASGEPPSPLGAGAASTGSLAAEQPWEERHWPGAADDGLVQPSCLEFATLEQGLR